MGTIGNVASDLYEVKIAGSAAGFHASVSVGGFITKHQVKSALTGDEVLGELVQGRTPTIELEMIEATLAQLRQYLGMGVSDTALPALGALLPTVTVQIHLVADGATTTRDLYFYAVSFGDCEMVPSDGVGEARWKVVGTCQRDSSGNVFKFGPP